MKEKKILFISANQHTDPYPVYPIGLSYLTTYLKEHLPDFDISIIDLNFNSIEEIKEKIISITPTYIGVSFRNIDDVNSINRAYFVNQYKDIIEQIKSVSDAKIIIGGSGFSIFPELMYKTINPDFAIYGEGEETMLRLIERLEENQDYTGLSRLVYRKNGQCIFNNHESYFSDLALNFEDQLLDFYWEKSGMLNVQPNVGALIIVFIVHTHLLKGKKLGH